MAATAAGRRLTEAHRLAQVQVGALMTRHVMDTMSLLDPENVAATQDRWLRVNVPEVERFNRLSARLSAEYLARFRSAELGAGADAWAPVLARAVPTEQVVTSLSVTGPVALRDKVSRGVDLSKALNEATASAAGSATRLALNGGRSTVSGAIASDRRVLGFARVTSGRSCAFCAMLASRGPVYSRQTGSFRSHDHCKCTTEPVYRRDAAWPAGSEQYRDLWASSTEGLTGNDAMNAFRRALSGT